MEKELNDSKDIRRLVDAFHKRAEADDLLGPIFSGIRLSDKNALYEYWSKVLLTEPSDQHERFPEHITLMFTTQHFFRWRTLFIETIDKYCTGPTAEKAKVMVIRKSEEFLSRLELSRF